jgi:hypothetical protein
MSTSVTFILITSFRDLGVYPGKERHERRYISSRVRQRLAGERLTGKSGKLLFERMFSLDNWTHHGPQDRPAAIAAAAPRAVLGTLGHVQEWA